MTAGLANRDVSPRTLSAWRSHLGHDFGSVASLRRRLAEGTLPEAFSAAAARDPGKPAVTIGDRQLSHGDLDIAAGRAARSFRALGLSAGDRVIFLAATTLDHVVAYLALLRLGVVVALANPSYTREELRRLVDAVSPALAVGGGTGLGLMSDLCETVGVQADDREITAALVDSTSGDPLPVAEIDPRSSALLAFTSGSTGAPKAVPLSHRNLLASIRGVMWAWRWSDGDRLVHALPLSHQHGLGGLHATLIAGSQAVLLSRFDPRAFVDAVVEHHGSVVFGVPATYERLRAHAADALPSLRRLRLLTSGSAPLAPALASQIGQATDQLPLERYGSTESGLNVSNPYEGPRIPGTVGIPLPGVEVMVVDGRGEPAPDGQSGEVLVRGPQVFEGYRDAVDGEDVFLSGWFRMGDLGVIEPDTGYLRLVGRVKDVIITGGMNVTPAEVETVLGAVDGVEDVVVVGVPSVRWGEEVVAFAVAGDSMLDPMWQAATNGLAPYKRPKRILLVGRLPRDEMGKLDKRALVGLAGSSGEGGAI